MEHMKVTHKDPNASGVASKYASLPEQRDRERKRKNERTTPRVTLARDQMYERDCTSGVYIERFRGTRWLKDQVEIEF